MLQTIENPTRPASYDSPGNPRKKTSVNFLLGDAPFIQLEIRQVSRSN